MKLFLFVLPLSVTFACGKSPAFNVKDVPRNISAEKATAEDLKSWDEASDSGRASEKGTAPVAESGAGDTPKSDDSKEKEKAGVAASDKLEGKKEEKNEGAPESSNSAKARCVKVFGSDAFVEYKEGAAYADNEILLVTLKEREHFGIKLSSSDTKPLRGICVLGMGDHSKFFLQSSVSVNKVVFVGAGAHSSAKIMFKNGAGANVSADVALVGQKSKFHGLKMNCSKVNALEASAKDQLHCVE